ncbi:MAG: hypothetical protein HXX13_04060 [Bacteroidetes bacterium]|nr:hypothetical protein [Bacteroidota bacterium]
MKEQEMNFNEAQMLRMKAEEKLKENAKLSEVPEGEVDVKKLLHELQVHQIELEMQNEELRLTYETAETALRKYTRLFDLAPIGFFTINQNGTIHDLNFTGADLLGERRFSLVDSNFRFFVSEGSKTVFNDFLTSLYETNSKGSCEVTLETSSLPLCEVYIEGVVAGDEKDCLLSVIDITKLKSELER